jgi:hypothetical protein
LPAADREAKEETLRAMPPAGASLEAARPKLHAPAEKRALKSEQPAPGSLSSAAAPLAVRLTAADPARAGAMIAELIRQLDGTVIARHDDPPSSLTARVEARRLPELLNRLALIGTMKEKPAIVPQETGQISCTITW